MNKKKSEKLLRSLDNIDEKYIMEAREKMKKPKSLTKIIAAAACFALILAVLPTMLAASVGVYLFKPYGDDLPNLTAYEGSEYFPLIRSLEMSFNYKPNPYKNNFEYFTAQLENLGGLKASGGNNMMGFAPSDDKDPPTAPGYTGPAIDESNGDGNGGNVDLTDNQVSGIEESDIVKRTDKYIFRLAGSDLSVYSINKEASERVGTFTYDYTAKRRSSEMYLSDDGNTVTIISTISGRATAVEILSLDVSDVKNIKQKARVTLDGNYKSSRVTDGKILLVTEFYFNYSSIDYTKPETFVPRIDYGNGAECIEFEDIIFPESIGNTRYNVVALMDEETHEVLGASALLNYTDDIYVSHENIYLMRTYRRSITEGDNQSPSTRMTDIAILSYSGDTLESKGNITVNGTIKDKWSMDEKDGYLRVVASTDAARDTRENASLYIYDLKDNSLLTSVERFAPDGETAESVRFDGDKLYVCTAVVITFTDPVYFFDLSDYSNITYTDTGDIKGFSTSLINLGEGFLLGIGQEGWSDVKVEVYEECADGVVSVDRYIINATYSTDYKSYYVNREENLFGFGVNYFHDENGETYKGMYILLGFDGYELTELARVECSDNCDRMRGIYIDGYLYLTSDSAFKVVKI